jgi:GTP-binding protein EngB required for normal cell division
VFEFTFQGSENPFYLYDLPGYGHARVSKEQKKHWNQLIPLFFSNLTAHDLCIQIQDARHLMMDSDLEFLNLVNQYHPPLCLLVNKWDKLKKQADRSKVNNTIKNKIMPLNNVSYIFKSSTISHLGEAEILSCFYQKLMASDF